MRLIAIRHAQSEWNAVGRVQGQHDTRLTHLGHAQAQALVERLSRISWDALWCSDLTRARDTAAPLLTHTRRSAVYDARLREIGFGAWEGEQFESVRVRDPQAYQRWRSDPECRGHGGESLADVARRAREVLEHALCQHRDGTILWVAHGGFLRLLACTLLDLSPENYWRLHLDSASISVVHVESARCRIAQWNDTRHLDGLEPVAKD